MLGGKIEMISQEGEGSEFYFWIPGSSEIINEESSEKVISFDKRDLKSRVVLIVEDDETSAQHIFISLEKEVDRLLHATNGLEALEVIKQNPDIDLVLLDMKMPIMDGYTAAGKMRKNSKFKIAVNV
jgi:PleD family two-component response regulator